jgi:hypothetical protein
MTPPKKLTHAEHAEEQQAAVGQQQSQTQAPREFATVEEMLRHDAKETHVPETIGQRLQETVRQIPAPPRQPWWRKFFGA